MAVYITYFVHGTSVDNEKDISSGWSDVGLSETGIEQAKALRGLIQGKHFDAIFCSDLQRAKKTAELALSGMAPIYPDKRLRECSYGIYNAKPSATVEPIQESHIIRNFPEGESYEDVKSRMTDLLAYLKKNFEGKHVALVAHKAPQLALDVLLKHKTWKQAFDEDWRKRKAWQPGWDYILE